MLNPTFFITMKVLSIKLQIKIKNLLSLISNRWPEKSNQQNVNGCLMAICTNHNWFSWDSQMKVECNGSFTVPD